MKKQFLFFIFLLFLACSSGVRFQPKLDKKDTRIAVLPFSGIGISRNLKYLAADELTTLLYLEKKLPVIDRSQVNYVVEAHHIENPYILSKEELITIADTLKATTVVLGLIEKVVIRKDNFEESGSHLTITLRFLDGDSAEVIGMMFDEQAFDETNTNAVRELLKIMIEKM